jgi:hypothetical protein
MIGAPHSAKDCPRTLVAQFLPAFSEAGLSGIAALIELNELSVYER